MKKKIMIYILMAVGTLFLLTGCKKNVGTPEDNAVTDESDDKKEDTDQEKKVFGFCGIDMSNPFYATLKDSVQSALEEQGDKLLIKDPAGDAERQNTQIQELIEEDVDAVFLCPVDWKKIEPALDALEEADIPVINLDTKVYESGKVAAFVGSDNRNAGYVCGEDLVERKPDGGQVVIVENLNVNSVCERITGFEEAVSKGAFEVVKRIQTGNDVSGLKQQVAQVLAQNPDLDAIMCGDDQMAEQVREAITEAGQEKVYVYSVDGSPASKKALVEHTGGMMGIGAQSPINLGKKAVKIANAVLNGEDYEKETYEETFFINRDNVEMYGTDGWQ